MANLVFTITQHARERFVERFSEIRSDFNHLRQCGQETCQECNALRFVIERIASDRSRWNRIIRRELVVSEEIKIFHNDARFVDYMYTNYGFHRFRFFARHEALFAAREEEGENVIITCMNVNNPVNGSRVIANFLRRPKYNKKCV